MGDKRKRLPSPYQHFELQLLETAAEAAVVGTQQHLISTLNQ